MTASVAADRSTQRSFTRTAGSRTPSKVSTDRVLRLLLDR